VRPRHIHDFLHSHYAVAHFRTTPQQLAEGEAFLAWVVSDEWKYDWAAIVGMAPYLLTGGRFMFASAGVSAICSALAAEYSVRARNAYYPKHASMMMPSRLAKAYGVRDPV
jgi:hypothetical protein